MPRLYVTEIIGSGVVDDALGIDDAFRSSIADLLPGVRVRRIADLRLDRGSANGSALWMAYVTQAQHDAIVGEPSVTYVPFEDSGGNVLTGTDTVADIDPTKRQQILNFLEARHIPTGGIGLQSTINHAVTTIARRMSIRARLKSDDFVEDMDTVTIKDIPAQRRQRINSRLQSTGLDTSGLNMDMTIREAIAYLVGQWDGLPGVEVDLS